jgi:hypothetical protein
MFNPEEDCKKRMPTKSLRLCRHPDNVPKAVRRDLVFLWHHEESNADEKLALLSAFNTCGLTKNRTWI